MPKWTQPKKNSYLCFLLFQFIEGINPQWEDSDDVTERTGSSGSNNNKGQSRKDAQGRDLSGVAVVQCNELGQFMLREIVQANDSVTHVSRLKKHRYPPPFLQLSPLEPPPLLFSFFFSARLLFVMCLDNATGSTDASSSFLSPQLRSRAHLVLHCANEQQAMELEGSLKEEQQQKQRGESPDNKLPTEHVRISKL